MDLVYVYQGGRDPDFEAEIAGLFPGARTVSAQAGLQGLTEVTLELPQGLAEQAAERLRGRPRIVDAARGSLGEGA